MGEKRKSFAAALTRKVLVWVLLIILGVSYVILHFEAESTRAFYAEIYHHKMLIANEYTRRVISDVHVAVTNNLFYIQQTLDNPDCHKKTLERIIENGTRVRSCGINFIEDYYPQKGHKFCPYAWRNDSRSNAVSSIDMGEHDEDYIESDWFEDVVKTDSARWSDPFYDSFNEGVTLSSYLVPVHDNTGKTVAVIGADISLDWLTCKLGEQDSMLNNISMPMANKFEMKSSSFIINHDGKFITHFEKKRILKDNFFSMIESCDGSDAEELINKMKHGIARNVPSQDKFLVNGEECYIFYTPVKYTQWVLLTIVPCHAIDVISYLNGFTIAVLLILSILAIMVVYYLCTKRSVPA